MPEYFETVKKKVAVNPCLACGSQNIELWDCGYSSFNPGGGRCLDCKREVREMVSPFAEQKQLAAIWNAQNDVAKRLVEIEAEIGQLSEERTRLEQRK